VASLASRTVSPSFNPPIFDRALLETLPVAVYVCDKDGRLLYYNRRAAELWGYEPELNSPSQRYCGSHKIFLPDGTQVPRSDCPMVEALRTGTPVDGLEAVIERPDGDRVSCLVNIALLRNASGKIIGAVNCLQDISESKRAAEKMRESQELLIASELRFRSLFEHAAVGIEQVALDGRLLVVNETLCSMLGYGRDELSARTFRDITHRDDLPAEEVLLSRLLSGAIPRYAIEKRYLHKSGEPVWVRVTSSLALGMGKAAEYRISIIEDITERKDSGRALQESTNRFRELLDALPAAVYTTDSAGRITFYNQAAVEFSGRRPELGTDQWCISWRLYWPDGTRMPHDECPMAISLKEDRLIRGVEAIAERPDGTRVHFIPYPTPLHDASGALVGAVNMLVDITDRKKAEQALQQLNATLEQRIDESTRRVTGTLTKLHESERRFRLLVEGVFDYAIFMLDPNGFVTNWNAGAARIKGYTAKEIVGQHFSRFYSEEDRENGVPVQALETARRTGKYEAEGWRLRKDGTTFWASVVIDTIRDEAGQLVGFAKVTRDLTEKRVADEKLRHSQKMEAIGQLTGGVAHDFNNLLTAIVGNLELMATILPAQERAQRYLEAATRAASRGSRLTEHLLAFSRRQELRPEIVSINQLLRDIFLLCQRTAGEGVGVALRLQEDLWTCNVDASQFEASVLNLSANARDAMNGSGRLTIATENVTARGTDGIDLDAGEYVVLSVTDTGCGMSAAVLARAFEPFYTTKELGKGTGLGLSQVYGFSKQSGGVARIESKTGVGTTVRIYLPRIDGKIGENVASKDSLSRTPIATATILVVEDDLDVREMVVEMLSHLGYRILVATTGPEALAMLRRDKSVDLLFSDVVMPASMSGVELARTARRLRPGLSVLLSSGHVRHSRSGAIEAEFPFIAKPYRPSTLGHKLKEVLANAVSNRIP
jgi:PAS domain S-box-containing protein